MAVLLGIAAAPWSGARGYNEKIHVLLEERALPSELLAQAIAPASLDDADALRREIWAVGGDHPDQRVRERFAARYPSEVDFDRWAFKEFLALNPEADVYGIDRLPTWPARPTVRDVLTEAARHPDDDKRNQSRFAHDAARQVKKDRWGVPLPADPAQLDMGGLTGPASQGHAHYGLPKLTFSDDPDVLEKEPRRFAYPPTSRAFAPDFAQTFTDLAICAATQGREGGSALGWLYLGHAHHYLGDVANQIHTLQAIYAFFKDAKIEQYKEDFASMGGLLRSRPDFVTIGIRIIRNHHLLAEDLFAKRIDEALAGKPTHPAVVDALAAIARGDGASEQAFDARKVGVEGEFGRVLTEEVIEASSREGGDVYELIRSLAKTRLSRVDGVFDDGMDPDEFLTRKQDPAALERFYRLQGTGFARAGSALRRHVRLFRAAVDTVAANDEARRARFVAVAQRLVATQIRYLDERDARLAAFVPKPPAKERIDWRWPLGQIGFVLLVASVVVWRVRVRRRKRRAKAAAADTAPRQESERS